jgi:hypothetical protein
MNMKNTIKKPTKEEDKTILFGIKIFDGNLWGQCPNIVTRPLTIESLNDMLMKAPINDDKT